jgi:hypothetical protein
MNGGFNISKKIIQKSSWYHRLDFDGSMKNNVSMTLSW